MLKSKIYKMLISSLILLSIFGFTVPAVGATAGVIPDPVLRKIIQLKLGLGPDVDITASDVAKVSSLSYSGYAASVNGKITNLSGLQYASSLMLLDINNCNVSDLDPIKDLVGLKTLVILNNPIDLTIGSPNYYIVQTLESRGCSVVYNTPQSSSYLTNIQYSVGTMTPSFTAGVYQYAIVLPDSSAGKSVLVTPVKADSGAKMRINNRTASKVKVSIGVGGSATVTIKVTAKDKSSIKTYKIKITRPSSNNYLSGIRISCGKLLPKYSKTTSTYTLTLTIRQSKVTITPRKAVSSEKVFIDGKLTSSKKIVIDKGSSTLVTISVVAQNGDTRLYYVTVTRAQ